MLEEIYKIKVSRLVANVCIYFITSVPAYIILFQRNILGFCTVLLIENIMTYYLFEDIDLLEIISEELSGMQMVFLLISVIIAIGMFILVFFKYSDLFIVLVTSEILFKIISKQLKRLKINKKEK